MNQKEYFQEVKHKYNEMNSIWDVNDKWHYHTYLKIKNYLNTFYKKHNIDKNMKILNAGSAGHDYGLPFKQIHLDIADKKISHIKNHIVGDIQNTEFRDSSFDLCLCVGSVINYCDAQRTISELSRITKKGGYVIIEFENSLSYEYLFKKGYGKNIHFAKTFYKNAEERIWIYSLEYIQTILKSYKMKIINIEGIHLVSPLIYRITKNETLACKFLHFDNFQEKFTNLKKISSNIILTCLKV